MRTRIREDELLRPLRKVFFVVILNAESQQAISGLKPLLQEGASSSSKRGSCSFLALPAQCEVFVVLVGRICALDYSSLFKVSRLAGELVWNPTSIIRLSLSSVTKSHTDLGGTNVCKS